MNLLNLFNNKPKPFDISAVKYKKTFDNQLTTKLIYYLQSYYNHLSKHSLHKIMVGIDGGVNNWVAAKLLKQALGENVVAVIFDISNSSWTNTALELCKQLELHTYILQREELYQAELRSYRYHKFSDIRNFYQRFMHYNLLIQADKMKAVLVDTFDKSSRLLGSRAEGFYGHLMPFYSLYKSELDDLSKILNTPNQFRTGSVYQDLPYPDNLVLTWDKVDPILFLLTEKQLGPEEITQQFNIELNWLKKLKSHIDNQPLKISASQFII